MSFRTDLLSIVDAVRGLNGPGGLDLRTNQLTVRKRTWSGTYVRDGSPTDVDLVLSKYYPVRHIREAEVNGSAGVYQTGDVLIDHITPFDGGSVGYTRDQLNPTVTADNVEIIYLLTGSHPGEYSLVECRTFRPFTYQLILRRTRSTP